jgi:hypothetical protein
MVIIVIGCDLYWYGDDYYLLCLIIFELASCLCFEDY